jgi:hypothetical protein
MFIECRRLNLIHTSLKQVCMRRNGADSILKLANGANRVVFWRTLNTSDSRLGDSRL